jgi:hypothetical protein
MFCRGGKNDKKICNTFFCGGFLPGFDSRMRAILWAGGRQKREF